MDSPARGEVWLADLNPIRGREQAGRRPVLVFSHDFFNRGPSGLVVLLPITSTLRPIPSHVRMDPPEGGLRVPSMILCDGIRSVSRERLLVRWGAVSRRTLLAVEDCVRILLAL